MENLSPDCLQLICNNLAAEDILAFGGVCRVLRDTSKSSRIWNHIARENRLRVNKNQTAFEVVVHRMCQSCLVQRPAKNKPFCSYCLAPPSRVWKQLFYFQQVKENRQRRLMGVITMVETKFFEACGTRDLTVSTCDRVLEAFASRLAEYPTFVFKATRKQKTSLLT